MTETRDPAQLVLLHARTHRVPAAVDTSRSARRGTHSRRPRRQSRDGGVRPHDLRHTCASLAISAGANVKVVRKLLGHRTAVLALDRYGHLYPTTWTRWPMPSPRLPRTGPTAKPVARAENAP
ncbi:MAG TPA: tyrosine-type recombinase/integrase [Mycobacterium sp.]|nr:tyrosine-type recombinase/integrase [Mycobacterium sp.]